MRFIILWLAARLYPVVTSLFNAARECCVRANTMTERKQKLCRKEKAKTDFYCTLDQDRIIFVSLKLNLLPIPSILHDDAVDVCVCVCALPPNYACMYMDVDSKTNLST